MADAHDIRLKRLKFRAWHRGFVEADLILGPGSSVPEPMRTRHRERLAAVFKVYGDICTELGETEVAERCRERSVIQVTSVDQAPQE